VKEILKWLAAVGAVAAVAGLNALAASIGIPVAGIDPFIQMLIAAGVVKLVNFLVGKIQQPA
jgi:hypothetical protein